MFVCVVVCAVGGGRGCLLDKYDAKIGDREHAGCFTSSRKGALGVLYCCIRLCNVQKNNTGARQPITWILWRARQDSGRRACKPAVRGANHD